MSHPRRSWRRALAAILALLLNLPLTLATVPVVLATSDAYDGGCSEKDGASVTDTDHADSGPAEAIIAGPPEVTPWWFGGRAYADDEAQVLRGRASASSELRDTYQEHWSDCSLNAETSTTLAIEPGDSGLAPGTPVTVVLDLELTGSSSALTMTSPGSTGWRLSSAYVDGAVVYEVLDGSTQLARFDATFSHEAHSDPGNICCVDLPPGYSRYWSAWVASESNAQPYADADDESWVECDDLGGSMSCTSGSTGVGDAGSIDAAGDHPELTTIEFEAAVGDVLDLGGSLWVSASVEQGASGAMDLFGDVSDEDGFRASFAPGAGSEGIGLVVGEPDPALPEISIGDASVSEGHVGTSTLTFTVGLSAASAGTVTVDAATVDGTATAGDDYTAVPSTTVTFAPGDTSETVSVSIAGDTTTEPDETLDVQLSNAAGATISDSTGVGTIVNDDATTISIGDASATEGTGGSSSLTFTVSLSNPNSGVVTVHAKTVTGTAIAGDDFTAIADATVTFAAGDVSEDVVVSLATDGVDESDEAFDLELWDPTNATIVDGTAIGTILDDDTAPSVSIGDVTLQEGRRRSATSFTFPISLSAASTVSVSVHVATADGSAVGGSDFTALPDTLVTFAPGETTKSVTILVSGDGDAEATETFDVVLTSPTNATIGDGSGLGTIVNDDPTVSIAGVSRREGDPVWVKGVFVSQTGFAFQVSLDQAAPWAISVDWAVTLGTADGFDLAPQVGSVVIPAGQRTATITVWVERDTDREGDETFFVTISGPATASDYSIGTAIATGTIRNDDR